MYQPPSKDGEIAVLLERREPRRNCCPSSALVLTSARVPLEAFCCDKEILVDKPRVPIADGWLADPKGPVSCPRKELYGVWSPWLVRGPCLQGGLAL